VTVAVNCLVVFTAKLAEVGLMLTETDVAVSVTVTAELALLLGSALLMILTV